jgi:RNA polymerase sigma factor (sigma-70 family)
MSESSKDLAGLIVRMKAGDSVARDDLFAIAFAQLDQMARKRLNTQFGRLRLHGVETGDILDDAMVQLVKRLKEGHDLERLTNEGDFFIMVAQYVRWALLNTAKRVARQEPTLPPDDFTAGETTHPHSIEQMTEFHAEIERLPPDQRVVFELRYFGERTYEQAAEILGVHRDTVKRRYRDAKETLAHVMQH